MSSTIAKWLLLLAIACIELLNCEQYQHRPTIKTSDGDLILEPALDKNIYLRPNGPKSSVFVGDVDILKTKTTRDETQYIPSTSEDIDQYFNGPNGILPRVLVLENEAAAAKNATSLNITALWRKVNELYTELLSLQIQINNKPKDQCDAHPCQHGGTCLNLVNGYHCLCPSNWEGKDCDVDVNECRHFAGTDLGCQNGATCINKPGTYECLCKPTWFGVHCTTKAKDCSAGDFEMCGFGTCIPVNSGEGIKCICHQGWTTNVTSIACLTDVNECDSHLGPRCSANPKVECVNVPGSFRCGQCPVGYEGDGYICNDIDECITIHNGGCSPMVTCHNTIGSRICGTCPPGYQGDGETCTFRGSCNINHGGCHSSAQCTELPTPAGVTVQCVCPEGMDGDGQGFAGCYVSTSNNTTGCEKKPCGDHGRCHDVRSGYTCICNKGYGGAHCDSLIDGCTINPCKNGGVCRQDQTLGFRCECTAQYTGSLCQVKSKTCGGVLNAEEGSIAYPLSNTTKYNNNAQCSWLIHTVADKVINVTFSKFIVELTPECTSDFLQIHDGRRSSSQPIGRFCGNDLPKGGNILSSHNYLYLWFHSDGTVAKDGFALHWTSVKPMCGGEINITSHGHISSPGSPGPYPPNRDCYWHLIATPGKRISLHFFALDIEVHVNCSFDYLAIYDGEHTTDQLLSRYCNTTQPAPVESASSHILIHFHSDAYGSGNGFQIAYAPIDGIPGCGGYFTADSGEIVAPTYSGLSVNNFICEYKIKTSAETKIKIKFKSFGVGWSFLCKDSYLKIYDGSSADSKIVGQFCGNIQPKPYTSSSNTLYLQFKTNRGLLYEAFRIGYESVCEKQLLGDSGTVSSPMYPFSYPKKKLCEYIIKTEPGKAIQLTFQDFDIEKSNGCIYDFVEIRDGPDINSTFLGKYCGGLAHMPPVQTSTHNYMYVRFQSDTSASGTGFFANYTTLSTECGGIYRDTTGEIDHPPSNETTYDGAQTCQWFVVAPHGMRIKLTWSRFAIENTTDCASNYLELVEIDENNENDVIGKYCGSRSPPAFTTTTNRLRLTLFSIKENIHIRFPGFSLSYTILDERTHCGGNFIKTHGYIRSPGWPEPYNNNLDCIWTITVPAGQQIALNIINFELEPYAGKQCDNTDYLIIRNGGSANSPLIDRYCGLLKVKRITSLSNALRLYFYSDSYYSGKGFNIEWDGTINGCGGTLSGSSGSITSPNYPSSYHENAECFYRIVTNTGSRIRISFTELDFERPPSCNDYIEIYDGRDTNAPSLGKYCIKSNETANIETTTNYAFIKFRSDFYNSGKGFALDYITACNNNITGRYGVIESPDFPNSYPLNLKCFWNIQVPKGNKINVTFTHFDVFKYVRPYWHRHRHRHPWQSPISFDMNYEYPSYSLWDYDNGDLLPRSISIESCSQDYLQMKENSDSTFSNKICGNSLPSAISTKGNSFQIKFVTGAYGTPRSGFRLEWAIFGCGGHILQDVSGSISFNKTQTTGEEMECEWLIETSPGRAITIAFSDIYMFQSKNCVTDGIEIYNGRDTKAPLLAKICHKQKTTIASDSNYMLVRFVKLSAYKDFHFDSFFYSDKSRCGSRLDSMFGFFYSKNYPKNYDNNLDCIWYIEAPENHLIEINFMDLDLYSSVEQGNDDEDCGDSILIYDTDNYSPLSNYTYRICPNTNKTQIVTKYRGAVVQFLSNSNGTAKGFKANFTVTCGALIFATQDGIITNEKYINHSKKTCTWTIVAPALDQKISLTLTHMSLPKDADIITNRTCPSTFLRVFNGNDDRAPLIDEYCGRKVPPMIVSEGNAVTIQLGSYTDRMDGQFSLHYSPISNTCGGNLTAEEGSIASPLYPHPYPVDADCEWMITTSPGNTAYITFERFDLEYSEGCNEDYLELRENDRAGQLLNVYCGNSNPINDTRAGKIYIKFHSSSSIGGLGFLLHFGYLHENYVEGEFGEIASPLYPIPLEGIGEYNWRISSSHPDNLILTVKDLEIPSHGDISYNKLTIFDGFSSSAPILEVLSGIIDEKKVIQTSSNVVYMSLTLNEFNTGAKFLVSWTTSSNREESSDFHERINCGSNQTELVTLGQVSVIKSPNYPENYRQDLNCEWIYRTQTGRHLSISFTDFDIEEAPGCSTDSISIYSSDSQGIWKDVIQNVCESTSISDTIKASRYMKIKFRTDSSVNKKGFFANVISECGGLITDLSGEFGPTWFDQTNCNWTIKVRPGRTIGVRFSHFNITNKDDHCVTSVVIRNGDSGEAPLLASGRYCGYASEQKSNIVTSSNALYVSYKTERRDYSDTFQSFKIYYEEKNYECGTTSKLTADSRWEIIQSPNYPSVPIAYTECVWVFTGPPGEILRIDVIDRFDIDHSDDCETEFVEIRDGSSSLSPPKGRFCGDRPSTIKTSSNTVYIKYSTQLAEPRDGFKANVSIDVCGGTIIAEFGEVKSPGYPHLQVFPPGTVCEWHVIGPQGHSFLIKVHDIHLPQSELNCTTKLDMVEILPGTMTPRVFKTICDNAVEENMSEITTWSNNFTIKLTFGKTAKLNQVSENSGFRITFEYKLIDCGNDIITTSEGYLTTPNYPYETESEFCYWYINVPDKSRRVRLEIMDSSQEKESIYVYDSAVNYNRIMSIDGRVYETLGHELELIITTGRSLTKAHRFKAKFSSDEPALCGGKLSSKSHQLVSPDIQREYTCKWHYDGQDTTATHNNLTYSSIFLTVNFNSSVSTARCLDDDPHIEIESPIIDGLLSYRREICVKQDIMTFRIPSIVFDITAVKETNYSFYFQINWKKQPCGGIVYVSTDPINIINTPDSYNDTIDCAWALMAPENNRVQIKLEGLFSLNCDDEYVILKHGLQKSPIISKYCRDQQMNGPLAAHYTYMYVQYHSNAKGNNSGIKLMANTVINQCGGLLTSKQKTFTSPNYLKAYSPNEECAWEIHANLGYRISLKFIDRFVIEDSPECTKDVVIIYDWKDDTYEEIARLCGRNTPDRTFSSTYDRLKVVLRTDAKTNLDGFKARWTPICGGRFPVRDEEQVLYSPGYPDKYGNDMDCSYELFAPYDQIIELKFLEFQLEGDSPECNSDSLTVKSQRNYEDLQQVFCGNTIPSTMRSDELFTLEFKTDSYLRKKGFKLSYIIYKCGGRINDTTIITSSFGDDDYDRNLNCTWLIEAPSKKIVVAKFFYIDLESEDECEYDYVALFDGMSVDSEKRLALLCGYVNSSTILWSTRNSMVLEFITDHSRSYKGFKAIIYFSYSELEGCGGQIDLNENSSRILKYPLKSTEVYENFLDCHWSITSPPNTVIKITFTKFRIATCRNVNQTAIGYSNCDCDFVGIKDGLNLHSFEIGTYCGDTLPPQLTASANVLSIRLSSDGELESSGFEATLTVHQTQCGETLIPLSYTPRRFKSPGYDAGSIAPGVHCVYRLDNSAGRHRQIRITILNLQLRSPVTDLMNVSRCLKDRLIISSVPSNVNITVGNNLIMNHVNDAFFDRISFYESDIRFARRFELCGHKESVDFYVYGGTSINLITSSDTDSTLHRGVEIEVAFVEFCGRNYTEPQGRVQSAYAYDGSITNKDDCYTLITAPENHTISAYFLDVTPAYNADDSYLQIFDGNNTGATQLMYINNDYDYPMFSTGRYMLLHNHPIDERRLTYDLNYVTTDKGRGCGGRLTNFIGVVTSPFYPSVYRHNSICEWILETPVGTHLMLRFTEFDLGLACDQNYLELVDSKGAVVRTFCAESPADYTSEDHYIKLVFHTAMNNSGKGWSALFVSTSD